LNPNKPDSSAAPLRAGGATSPASWIETLQAADLEAVRILSRTARSRVGRLCAIGISKLGNGWIYIVLAAMVFARWGLAGYKVILCAGINAGVTHSLYPLIKRRYRRRRPFKVDPELSSLLATLDEHSFPSGHAMTLAAVLTPIVMLWPSAAIPAVVMFAGLAWSRIATAHHYPSDVLAGAVLGIGLAYPISLGFNAVW
jgi:undecaprenyl-diphosphatase